jgi:ABC-type transporter Mla subunit MlaD
LFTQDNPDTPLNFLQFWQSGQYGGKEYLSTFWHIGDVARFDALLIGLIVVLTLVVGAIGAQRERSESKFEMAVDRERTALGLTLANALHGRRSASPESIGESLAEALNDLTQAARDVNDVAARLERATVGMDTLGPKLDVLNQHTDRLVGQSVQSITASMSALVSSVSQLNGAVATNVTQVFADATANLEEVSAQFSRIAASMELGAAQLREDLEHISRQVGNRGNR